MRTWVRALLERQCGRCRLPIRVGQPMLFIQPVGLSTPKVRCKEFACAGEVVPADLSEQLPIAPIDLSGFTRLGVLPLDFSRQHEREPGEEG